MGRCGGEILGFAVFYFYFSLTEAHWGDCYELIEGWERLAELNLLVSTCIP